MTDSGLRQRRRQRLWIDRGFVVVAAGAALSSVLILVVLIGSILAKGLGHLDWGFITGVPSRKPAEAGMYPAMIGSITICAICMMAAMPIGVATAILLHEFKPHRRWLRKAHGFVELNITNLAGVPSVVYGILGLTAFVGMFGLFGTGLEPRYSIGEKSYDVFYDEAGNALRAEVGADDPPIVPRDGMTLYDETTGEAVTVRLVQPGAADPRPGDLTADSEPQRVSEKEPWHVQLPLGRGVLAGGLTLMLVVLPIIIISAQEALRAVPNSLRHGALAMGSTRWQMVWRMTLPAAAPGIMTGSILAMSRAIGEAAPILIIAGLVYITFTPTHLMDDFTAMPLQIFDWASRPQEEFHRVAATGIIVLLAVLLTFNAVAVFIRYKFQRRLS